MNRMCRRYKKRNQSQAQFAWKLFFFYFKIFERELVETYIFFEMKFLQCFFLMNIFL